MLCLAACSTDSPAAPGIRPGGGQQTGTGEPSGEIMAGETLPAWSEGEMDIHFINTTTGECTFIIMPDGTQLLIDAASSTVATNSSGSTANTGIRSRWDPTKTGTRGSEIIGDHIRRCMEWTGNNVLDYVMYTHFHNDHIGGYSSALPVSSNSSSYRLNGATELLDEFETGLFMDRGWPDYGYPFDMLSLPSNKDCIQNYVKAVRWHAENKGLRVERFKAGSVSQIVPKTDKYDVKVRNIAVNGEIWTGTGETVTKTFPELPDIQVNNPAGIVSADNCPPENICSCVLRLSFGKFDYFAGADLQYNGRSTFAWKDAEYPCAAACGKVELMKADHHGSTNTNDPKSLKLLDPQAIVVCSWVDCQPRTSVLNSMEAALPETDFFITNFWLGARPDGVDDQVTPEEAARVKGYDGHIVVRVTDGGSRYRIMTITDSDGKMTVKSVSGPYLSR